MRLQLTPLILQQATETDCYGKEGENASFQQETEPKRSDGIWNERITKETDGETGNIQM